MPAAGASGMEGVFFFLAQRPPMRPIGSERRSFDGFR